MLLHIETAVLRFQAVTLSLINQRAENVHGLEVDQWLEDEKSNIRNVIIYSWLEDKKSSIRNFILHLWLEDEKSKYRQRHSPSMVRGRKV